MLLQMLEKTTAWMAVMEVGEEEVRASCEKGLDVEQAVRQRLEATAASLQRRCEAARAARRGAEGVTKARRTTAAEAAGQGGPSEVLAEAEGNNMAVLWAAGSREMRARAALAADKAVLETGEAVLATAWALEGSWWRCEKPVRESRLCRATAQMASAACALWAA